MNWLVLAAIAVGASAATAQEPSSSRDDVNTTMRIIIDPNADTPDDVLRKIAAAKPKRSGKSTDSLAKDLASPGQEEPDDGGIPTDPDTPAGPGTPDPTTPTPDPAPHGGGSGGGRGPDVGGAPDPRDHVGGLGHQVSDDAKNHGEDVRRHHDKPPGKPHDKPPHHPGSHPPATPPPPPTAPPRNPRPPGHQPPGHQPPGHQPPDRHPPKPG
jgi:hypothetical protein